MTKKYIGKRYVPKVMGEWNILTPYESLCIVTHNGDSYTSKKDVPVGIELTNVNYWIRTAIYNTQLETYRQEVNYAIDKVDNTILPQLVNDFNGKPTWSVWKELNERQVNVKWYGAKGDGIVDDSSAFLNCFNDCINNKLQMYIPNGTYVLNEKLIASSDINGTDSEKPIYIQGQSYGGVKIISPTFIGDYIMDFSRSKNVYVNNLLSDKGIKLIQYGGDFINYSRKRRLSCDNVVTKLSGWNKLINTKAPLDYSAEESGEDYTTYPIEIINNSGYNGIMINNFAVDDNGVTQSPTDNSAIGIIDKVYNSSGAILVDEQGGRSILQGKNQLSQVVSGVRSNLVFEVDSVGHIGIGCSTQNSDTNALGVATTKLRDNKPRVALYDSSNNNMMGYIEQENGNINVVINGQTILKGKSNGEVSSFAPQGISTNVQIRDSSSTRGLQFRNVTTNTYKMIYMDSDNNVRLLSYASGNDKDGKLILTNANGLSEYRPTLRNSYHDIGTMYFDTTLKKPIWWSGLSWVDAIGNVV